MLHKHCFACTILASVMSHSAAGEIIKLTRTSTNERADGSIPGFSCLQVSGSFAQDTKPQVAADVCVYSSLSVYQNYLQCIVQPVLPSK